MEILLRKRDKADSKYRYNSKVVHCVGEGAYVTGYITELIHCVHTLECNMKKDKADSIYRTWRSPFLAYTLKVPGSAAGSGCIPVTPD